MLEKILGHLKKEEIVLSTVTINHFKNIDKKINSSIKEDIFSIMIYSKIIYEYDSFQRKKNRLLRNYDKLQNTIEKISNESKNLQNKTEIENLINLKKFYDEELEILNKKKNDEIDFKLSVFFSNLSDQRKLEREILIFYNNLRIMRLDKIWYVIKPILSDQKGNFTDIVRNHLSNIVTHIQKEFVSQSTDSGTIEISIFQELNSKILKLTTAELESMFKKIGQEAKMIEEHFQKIDMHGEFRDKFCVMNLE